jgi:hypothetical protein
VCWQRRWRSRQFITCYSTITANWIKLASSSSSTEQDLWARLTILDQLVRERGRGERAEKEEEDHTYQAPRCIPGRHGEAVPARPTRRGRGETSRGAPGAPHLALPPAKARVAQALEHAQQAPEARFCIRVLGGGRSWAGRPPRSPRGGSRRRFLLVELVEGAVAGVSPKVATAEAIGVGRRGQATAAVIWSR